MPQKLADSLYEVITSELPNLQALSEEQAGEMLRPAGWTRKQELGHLIDSASNNHIRFVYGATTESFTGPSYAPDDWVRIHGYDELPWSSLVHFWFRYNALLVQVVQRITPEKLSTPCVIGGASAVPLSFVIEDYVAHMQHHIDQILKRETVRTYPGAAAAHAS